VRRKRAELWLNGWILHHDNAPAHKALSVKQYLATKSITKIEHPSYSPDKAPNDLWLFSKIKSALKGQRDIDFRTLKTSKKKKNLMTVLKAIPQQNFQKYFQQWQHRWAKYTAAQGEYFNGDPSQ
jgi:transposase